MPDVIEVLAPHGRDAEVIVQVLSRAGIHAERCPDLPALLGCLDNSAAIMVTEEALSGPGLPGLLEWLDNQPAWSDLPVLVLATKQAGPRSRAGAALLDRLGNALLLERPLNAETLGSVARSALRARARQVAVRSLNASLEQRVAERTDALVLSEGRFRAIFESFPDCLFLVDVTENGRFLYDAYNPVAERKTGLDSAEVHERPPDAFMSPDDAAAFTAAFSRCVETGGPVSFSRDVRLPRGNTTFDIVVTPLRDGGGRIARLLGVARDVTERNRLEERLRQAQKLEAVGQLTGGVAHDFNNLLQVVLSGLTLMERVEDPARRAQLADSVRRAAQRGGDLTKRLLTVARRQSLRPEPIDLGMWLRDGAAELLTRALRGDIRTEFKLPSGLPAVEADPAELELAILNLAVNARDAMPDGGTLVVAAEAVRPDPLTDPDGLDGSFVRLSVQDTGTGMNEETQARVFEPFFTTKGVGVGTGLGLAQVYGFARQSGGGVRLRSAPGRGTTVSLLLPVSSHAAADAASAQPASAEPGRAAAVLVCEDDDEVAALVVDMLTQLGHHPTRVGNAAAALGALADGRKVDLLFTDVMMPGGMDGLALAREAGRRRPGLAMLLTTGYTGGGAAAMPLGVPMLRKPYKIEDLALAVSRALNR